MTKLESRREDVHDFHHMLSLEHTRRFGETKNTRRAPRSFLGKDGEKSVRRSWPTLLLEGKFESRLNATVRAAFSFYTRDEKGGGASRRPLLPRHRRPFRKARFLFCSPAELGGSAGQREAKRYFTIAPIEVLLFLLQR